MLESGRKSTLAFFNEYMNMKKRKKRKQKQNGYNIKKSDVIKIPFIDVTCQIY
jgi:hypothetical protein